LPMSPILSFPAPFAGWSLNARDLGHYLFLI
jgi:hypothetical protein